MPLVWLSEALDKAESTLSIYSTALLSIIFAIVLVFMVSHEFNFTGVIMTILISGLVFLLATSTYGDNLGGSVPSTTYPGPPHLGLGGVSLQNWYPFTVPSHNQ